MIFSRSYLKEIGLHLLFVLGGMAFLVALIAAVRASATSQGAPVWMPLTLIPLIVGNALPYLIPVTLLVAVVLTYGRMAADGEDFALRVAGVRSMRLLLPALLAGVLVAAVSYPLSSSLLPRLYTQMRELSYRLRFAALENTDPSASELHLQGLHLLWHGRDPDGAFREVTLWWRERLERAAFPGDPGVVSDPSALEGPVLQVRARRGSLNVEGHEAVFRFEGFRTFQTGAQAGKAWNLPRAEEGEIRIDLQSLGGRPERQRKPDDFTTSEIRTNLSTGDVRRGEVVGFRYTLWKRVAIAVSALPLALLGAMLGWRLRRGGFLTAFAASFAVLITVFYPLYYAGNALVRSGGLSAPLGAWLPVLGLLPVLVVLGRLRPVR